MAAIPDHCDYKEYLNKLVCSIDNRNCMMQSCDNCPGKIALKDYITELFSSNEVDLDDIITYKQWMHTDRTALVSLQTSLEEFIDTVCNAVDSLRQHHFITKSQASYLRSLKETLADDTAIILLDFAENYSFLVQDAIQGYYWDNSQATLHPFAIYHMEEGELKCTSVVMISDCMKHDTTTVHAFISQLVPFIKEQLPGKHKLIYFSDGAASQYKNHKNLSNLCYHQSDYGLAAEWHFFATSHGKSPCDGLGGTTKRLVARASLQATLEDQILNPHQMFEWADQNIHGIKFIFVSNDDVQSNADKYKLVKRFSSSKTISGTRSHHNFIPVGEGKIEMRRLSNDISCSIVSIGDHPELHVDTDVIAVPTVPDPNEYQPGRYIACTYDNEWYIGTIIERSDEQNDVFVKFMKRAKTTNALSWPQDSHNECWVPFQDIISIINAPEVQGHGGRQYRITYEDLNNIQAKLPAFIK